MARAARVPAFAPWLVVCGGICVVVGVVAGINPKYGILAALGLMFVVVTVMDLVLGVLLFTVESFLDTLNSGGSLTGTKVIGLVILVSWLAHEQTRRGRDLSTLISRHPGLTAALVLLPVWAALSYTWAFSPGTALAGATRYAQVVMLFPIIFSAVREREQARWLIAAFVIGALISALYGFVVPTPGTSDQAGRFTGANGDANAEATILAMAIPLLIGLFPAIRRSRRLKLLACAGVVIMLVGLLETLSREGLLALGAVLVAGVVFGGQWRRKAAVVLILGATVTVGYYAAVAPSSATQRVTTASSDGRSSLWTVAMRVIESHPVLGVGDDNFLLVENRYLDQPGSLQAYFLVSHPKVTHNTFLEATADLGIPGLLAIVAILVACTTAAVRATWTFQRIGDTEMELMSRSLVLALVAVFTGSFFVQGNYEKFLWIPLALCPVLLRLARTAESEQQDALESARGVARVRRLRELTPV